MLLAGLGTVAPLGNPRLAAPFVAESALVIAAPAAMLFLDWTPPGGG